MRALIALLAALALALPAAHAQERAAFTQAELDQMLAPVALYPDSLLSQVLIAATYPLEVVEAARWARAHPGLVGDEAVRAAADKDWDPSVKSLLAFPQLLARMDEKLQWTRQLGEAFLGQEGEVMDTVQQLRQKARAAGHLVPDERVRVVEDAGTVVVEYADPGVVYVPYYDPWVVYGGWWWPAYPPVAWAPWPGYAVVRPGFWWGVGVGVSVGFFYTSCDWHHGFVKVVHPPNHHVRPRHHTLGHRPQHVGKWQHDPAHRRGVGYRHPGAQKRFGAAPPPHRVAQRRDMPPRSEMPRRETPRQDAPRSEMPRRETPRQDAPRREMPRGDRPNHAMPPAWRASTPAPRATAPIPRATAPAPRFAPPPQLRAEPRSAPRAVPYDRGHGGAGRTMDRADRGGGARANAPQHGAAQPHGFARNAGRHAGPVSVRPPVRLGVAGGRPGMAR
jgi:hypothetical protein